MQRCAGRKRVRRNSEKNSEDEDNRKKDDVDLVETGLRFGHRDALSAGDWKLSRTAFRQKRTRPTIRIAQGQTIQAAVKLADRKSTRLNSSHVSESRMP